MTKSIEDIHGDPVLAELSMMAAKIEVAIWEFANATEYNFKDVPPHVAQFIEDRTRMVLDSTKFLLMLSVFYDPKAYAINVESLKDIMTPEEARETFEEVIKVGFEQDAAYLKAWRENPGYELPALQELAKSGLN